jgi:nucleoside-diphosphate-sugar epimerase
LEHSSSWSIDIFQVYALSNSEPLLAMMWCVVKHYHLVKRLQLNQTKLLAFVREIERGYPDNPYHCSTHAADVVQGVFWFIETAQLKDTLNLSSLEIFSMLIAAAIHDYLHLGVNNKFLQVTQHAWAVRYNNVSILEMHACAMGCELMTR